MGKNSKPAPEDDEIDFDDIADALKELVEKIIDALDDSKGGTQSTTAPTITQAPLPTSATPCTDALDAYSSCSTAYNGTFSAIAATVQAGCLCNANPGFDFNDRMGRCYSYAQNRTQLRTYAGVIASGTADAVASQILSLMWRVWAMLVVVRRRMRPQQAQLPLPRGAVPEELRL